MAASSFARMSIRWEVPAGETRPITVALHGLMMAIRLESGCTRCSLSIELGERSSVSYFEEFSTQAGLESRLQGGRFASLAALLEQATGPPLIEFALPGGIRGLDYVEEVHRRQDAAIGERSGIRSRDNRG